MSERIVSRADFNRDGGSSLFFTPPPEDRYVCADFAIAEDICGADVPNLREAQHAALADSRLTSAVCVKETTQKTRAIDHLQQPKPSRKHSFATAPSPKTHLNSGLGRSKMTENCGLRSVDPKVLYSGGSITASTASSNGQSGLPRSHLPDGKIEKSRPTASILEGTQSSSGTNSDSRPGRTNTLLGEFMGYSSSDEEEAGKRFEVERKPTLHHQPSANKDLRKSKKTRQLKSAELVVSDTDIASESEPCAVTTPLLLQKKGIRSQSSIRQPPSAFRTNTTDREKAPQLQEKVPGNSSLATVKPKVKIAAPSEQRKTTAMNNKAMRTTGKKGAKQPPRSVVVKKQHIRHGPFIIDSDTESEDGSNSGSDDSTDVKAEERVIEEDEDGDDNWDAIPQFQPPERTSLDKRKPVSTVPRPPAQQLSSTRPKAAFTHSSQRAPVFDKAKLKAKILADKKNQHRLRAAPAASIEAYTEGQSSLATTSIPANFRRDSLKSEPGAQVARQGHVASLPLGSSEVQSAPQVSSRASLSNRPTVAGTQAFNSTKPASSSAKPVEAVGNGASTSNHKSGPTQNISKQHIASKHKLGASSTTLPSNSSIQGFTPVRKQNNIQGSGSAGLVGGLIQGIRQSEKPLDGALKSAKVAAVSYPRPEQDAQIRDRLQSINKRPDGSDAVDVGSDGVPRDTINAAAQSSGPSANGRAGTALSHNKLTKYQRPDFEASGRAQIMQTSATNTTRSSLQAPTSMVPTLKRKTAATESSSSAMPLQKKLNRTVAEPPCKPSSTMDPSAGMALGGTTVLSSTKKALGTLGARKSSASAPSPAIPESDLQDLATKNPVHNTLQTALGTISDKVRPETSATAMQVKVRKLQGDLDSSGLPAKRDSITVPAVQSSAEVSLLNKNITRKTLEPSNIQNAAAIQPPLSLLTAASSSTFYLPSLRPLASDVEPYFEFSIFNKMWSASDDESSIDATELTSAPCTNIDEANAHVETLFTNAREQYQQHFSVQFTEWTNKSDDHGCNVFLGTFAPIENPSKKSWMKFWVERHTVSAEAGRTPKDLKRTSFVAKTVYVLRLFRLVSATTGSDGDSEDSSVPPPDTTIVTPTKLYHPLPRTECYTTLDAANRAAKNLQIELSHKPTLNEMDLAWQRRELAKLNRKAREVSQAAAEVDKYWKTEFNGSGLGSRFELLVEKAGLCGPRNL